jgi:Uma2 family endonuclease
MVLHNISWETYERILADHESSSVPRFTYDRGDLEIMSPRPEHEDTNWSIALSVAIITESLGIEYRALGSTTFKRRDLERGFEADSCFYVRNELRMRGKQTFDLTVDPPPDIVVEIDITRSSQQKHGVFASLGVPEVWSHDGGRLSMFSLQGSGYIEIETSRELPGVTAKLISDIVAASPSMGRNEWTRYVRRLVRDLRS